MPAPPNTTDRGSCELRKWTVFAPGYWKGTLYPLDALKRMAANYAYLKPHLTPVAKLGHDVEQELQKRLQASMGFTNLGQVTDAGLNPDGSFWLTIQGIPIEVGGQINAGRINSGSVDLEREGPDPSDPAKKIDGPILTAISLLGEEQPALNDARLRMPRAVFADGSPVPPATSAAKWLDAMADVAKTFSARHAGNRRTQDRTARRQTLCFSDYSPEASKVTPEELTAALQALPVDQLKQVLAACGVQMSAPGVPDATGAPAAPAGPDKMSDPNDPLATYAADPNVPDWGKAMMSAFSAFSHNSTKRFGAVESAVADTTKKTEMSAAFAADYKKRRDDDRKATVVRDVEKAVSEGRLEYRDKDDKIAAGLTKSDALTFSEGDGKGKTHYQAWRDDLLSRAPSASFSESVEDAGGGEGADPWVEKTLATMKGYRKPAYEPAAK